MTRWDAIVVGGGHNGLVCAAYLARAGRKVLVLERRHVLGGAAVTEELHPGFRYSVCSYVVSLLRPDIIRELELPRHGLTLLPLECSFSPALPGEGPGLVRWPDAARTREEIAAYSPRDADRYPEFGRAMQALARRIKPLIDRPPPDPLSLNPAELMETASLLEPFRDLGPRGVRDFVKMMTMSSLDYLREWFEADALIAPVERFAKACEKALAATLRGEHKVPDAALAGAIACLKVRAVETSIALCWRLKGIQNGAKTGSEMAFPI